MQKRLSSVGRSCAPGVLRVCSAVVALSLSLFGAAACLSSVGRSGSPKTRSVRVGEHLYGEAPFLEVTLQMGVGVGFFDVSSVRRFSWWGDRLRVELLCVSSVGRLVGFLRNACKKK